VSWVDTWMPNGSVSYVLYWHISWSVCCKSSSQQQIHLESLVLLAANSLGYFWTSPVKYRECFIAVQQARLKMHCCDCWWGSCALLCILCWLICFKIITYCRNTTTALGGVRCCPDNDISYVMFYSVGSCIHSVCLRVMAAWLCSLS